MRPNSILILIVAIVMGGVAAFLARSWLLSAQVSTASRTVVVAARQLPFGTTLTDDNVEVIPWAAKTVPTGAFASKQELFKNGGRITLATVESDEPILTSKITGPGQRASLSFLLNKDKRAITIRVDDVRGVAGFIQPNDRVDVVLIRSAVSGSAGHEDYSDLLLQDVKVIAIDQIASERKDRPVVAKAVTLEVTPFQAQKISLATNVGHLSLILRKAGDSNVVADRRVTEADLSHSMVAKPRAPLPAPPAPPVQPAKASPSVSPYAVVAIVRNLRTEEYKVLRQEPGRSRTVGEHENGEDAARARPQRAEDGTLARTRRRESD